MCVLHYGFEPDPFKWVVGLSLAGKRPHTYQKTNLYFSILIYLGFQYMVFGPAGNRRFLESGRPKNHVLKTLVNKSYSVKTWLAGPILGAVLDLF